MIKKPDSIGRMLSVKELAKILGVSTKTIYALCDEDAIPYYRIGTGRGTIRFNLDEVMSQLRVQGQHSPVRVVTPLKKQSASSKKHLL